MNVVRSAGGGGGGGSFKHHNGNPAATNPTIRPTHSITELMRKTKFSKEEIRHLYRRFKQESPSGEVTKSRFATIFGTLFPGGECFRYSQFVFQNIDRSNTGFIRFEDFLFTLSILVHGTIEERVSWIFDLYDLDKDGKITKPELLQLVTAVFQLIIPIRKTNVASMNGIIEERTNQLFQNWDKNGLGFVFKKDFIEYCTQNETIKRSIDLLKLDIGQ